MTSRLDRIIHILTRIKSVFIRPVTAQDKIIEALDAALSETAAGHTYAVAMIADIDDFDALKSRSAAPDIASLLGTLENRLCGGVLSRDIVVHLPDGKFAIGLNPQNIVDEDDILRLAGQIQSIIAVPIVTANTQAKVTASIGCAIAGQAGVTTGQALLEAARIAQLEATRKGPNALRLYAPGMGDRIRLHDALRRDMAAALTSGAIQAYFQPQICLSTQAISGFEALARWQHDKHGLISPADFLPLLEDAGMMRPLGRRMLYDALCALKDWDNEQLNVPNVSVNMCAEELRNPALLDEIQAQLAVQGLGPERLVIEVLETVDVVDMHDPIVRNIRAISDFGCQIDLDDYGTGKSSAKSVQTFAVDRIKIDRSFITDVDQDKERQRVIKTILSMAKTLNVGTLAEGVELQSEIAHLASVGCGHAQGYAIARALPAPETIAWVKNWIGPAARLKFDQAHP